MPKVHPLELIAADGSLVPATIHVEAVPIPNSIWRNYALRLDWVGGTATATAADAFDALRVIRGQLAVFGLSPRCHGACRNFVMSPMASQMGGGLAGHRVEVGRPAGTDMVLTLEAGPDLDIVSVADQDAFKEAWWASLGLHGATARE